MAAPSGVNPLTLSQSRPVSIEGEFDPIAGQIRILYEYANKDGVDEKQLQALFSSTIMLCAKMGSREKAAQLLLESEKSMIFVGNPEMRAKLFSAVICQTVEDSLHSEGYELYKMACSFGVWNDQKGCQTGVEEKLKEVGFKI